MRRRILGAILGVTAAALIVLGVPLGWAVGRIYLSQQLTRLQQTATVAAGAVPAEGLHGPDLIEPPPAHPGIRLTYYDLRGIIAAGTGPGQTNVHVVQALGGQPSAGTVGSRLVAVAPITANEATIGAVEASSAMGPLTARIHRTWLAMAVLGMVSMAIAALIAIWQARRLTRPVDCLVTAADQLGDGHFALTTTKTGIAELDRAGMALEATSVRLSELMTRERAFTAHASHQLRTPLTALRLDLENALETPGVDQRTSIADAITDVDRLQETLEQLFSLARTGNPAGRRVALGEILAPLEQRWRHLLAQRGRRLTVIADPSIRSRPAPAPLAQVLEILLDNATDHGQGRVQVSAALSSGWLRVEVQDEGEGITSLPKPTPLTPAPYQDGHGLGLPLARALTEGADGRLLLEHRGRNGVIVVLVP